MTKSQIYSVFGQILLFVTTLPRVFYRGYPRVWTQPVLTPGADMRLGPGTWGGGLAPDLQPLVTRGGSAQGQVTRHARVI